jgi:antirestriction protein ArdC
MRFPLKGFIEMKAQDLIEKIVAEIIAEIEAGALPWAKPWTDRKTEGSNRLNLGGFALPLRSTGEAYRGINILSLWIAASENGFRGRYWFTFKQVQALGGSVTKGSKASGVIYADTAKKQEVDDKGETVEKSYAFLKAYVVFNSDQIEGLPEKFYLKMPVLADQPQSGQPGDRLGTIEIPGREWLAAIPAVIRHGGNHAYFSSSADMIQMPESGQFKTPQAYTSTLIHELTHWTGHKSRLDRLEHKRWGDDAYAFEELVAELGAAFGCANLGLVPDIRTDHAPYLATWLRALKSDPRALVSAAAKASQALDHLDGYSKAGPQEEAA